MRSRWGLGLTVFFGVFSLVVVGFGTSRVGPGRYASVIVSLVEFGVYLVPLAALTAGYDTVVGEYESGALNMLLALPVSNRQVLTGKYLGRLAVLTGSLIIGLGMGGVVAVWIVGSRGIALYSLFVLGSVLVGSVFLGLSVLVSTLTRRSIRALGYAQIVWLWFVLLHDLLSLGLIAELDLPNGSLEAMVLLNPTDLYRLLLLGQLDATAGGFAELLSETALASPYVLAALLIWVVVPVVLANYWIHRIR
jgi:Cu-processing system permease protein